MSEPRGPRQSRLRPKYRYECPDCESVVVYRILDAQISVGRTENFTVGGQGIAEKKEKLKRNYRCNECSTYHERVYDKKNSRLSRP